MAAAAGLLVFFAALACFVVRPPVENAGGGWFLGNASLAQAWALHARGHRLNSTRKGRRLASLAAARAAESSRRRARRALAARRARNRAGHWRKVVVTAYCPTCRVCQTGRRTYTGRGAFGPGAAVARTAWRRFTPLGSRVYVPRFGWLLVDDVGGGVRAGQIDVRVPSHQQAVRWGRRLMAVRIDRA